MSSTARTSTLLATERSLRPVVLATVVASSVLALVMLARAYSAPPSPWWLVAALAALAPALSNLHYLRTHDLTTIGMIPVAIAALLPAGLCVAASPDQPVVIRVTCAVMCACPAIMLAIFAFWFIRLRRTYSAHPQISPDAIIVVLGGAIKHGRPCQTLARRLDVAARLWHESPARTIVVTGGPTPDDLTTEAHEMARYLGEQGVDPAHILLEPTARNTRENISRSTALVSIAGIDRQLCVVSSDYHLWRALREARLAGVALTPIAAPTPKASVPQQWCREVLTILFGH